VRRSAILLTALLLGASLSLAACGKKGDPEAPDANQFPHQYPAPEAIPETGSPGLPPPPPPPSPTPGYQPDALTPLNPQYP
jgi:predicted small lipoprotein YifL